MSAQPKVIKRPHVPAPLVRAELRSNVVQWREQAVEQRIRTLPLPAPGEGTEPELVRPWVQNLVLGLVAFATIALAVASGAGLP